MWMFYQIVLIGLYGNRAAITLYAFSDATISVWIVRVMRRVFVLSPE